MSGISKKELVRKAYPGISWSNKVERMSEAQIIAVYLQLKKRGKVV